MRRAALHFAAARELRQDNEPSLLCRELVCDAWANMFAPKDEKAALTALQHAIAADPSLPEPYNVLGVLRLENAEFGPAIESVRSGEIASPEFGVPTAQSRADLCGKRQLCGCRA